MGGDFGKAPTRWARVGGGGQLSYECPRAVWWILAWVFLHVQHGGFRPGFSYTCSMVDFGLGFSTRAVWISAWVLFV